MARGSQAKEEITSKILSAFEGSFIHEKTIRIPIMENNETIEIKVTLTAAKDIIGGNASSEINFEESKAEVHPAIPSAEEVEKVNQMLERLNVKKG